MKLRLPFRKSKEAMKVKLSLAIRGIEIHRRHLENLRIRLAGRRRALFEALMDSIGKKDDMKATVYADEHAEIKRVLRVITSSEVALIQIKTRLESMSDIGDAFYHMKSAVGMVNKVSKSVANIVPSLENVTNGVNDAISTTLVQLGEISPNNPLPFNLENDSSREIVETAKRYALETERKQHNVPSLDELEARLPTHLEDEGHHEVAIAAGGGEFSPNFDTEFKPAPLSIPRKRQIEDQVRGYVAKRRGSFDVLDAAFSLGLPVEEVETAALTLANKGKISFGRVN